MPNAGARTREVEDKLSDALHAALTQRFIDRRTSALLKGLKREDAMLTGISEDGEVTVEGHFAGRLAGLDFVPDPRAGAGLEGRAVRNAAWRALKPEVSRRLARVAAVAEADVVLERDGRVRVDGAPVLKPRLELICAAARERLESWLARKVASDLRPLSVLEAVWRDGKLPPDVRGLAFRLLESAGALDRPGEDLEHMNANARAVLLG